MRREKIDPYKRELLYRKAQGKMIFDKFKAKLNALLSDNTERIYLGLQETDEVISNIKGKSIFIEERRDLKNHIESINYINDRIRLCDYYLFLDSDWKYCGAVFLKSGFRILDSFDFDEVVSDEIRLISCDFNEVLSIDYSNSVGDEPFECRFIRYNQ
ncbi:hypothetical protein QM999_16895 [Pectobacterium cacticida]|uniref:hypothetical protein n=1 Tax=Pectobacterium cacticida TaxID=69221 RepID=UPI002FF0CCF2